MSARRKQSKPVVIRRGSVSVKIYSLVHRSQGKHYPQFALVYRQHDGKRVVRRFSDLETAKREAELSATKLASGEFEVLQLGAHIRNEYSRSLELLNPLGMSVYGATEDYTNARRKLPAGISLTSVVEFYLAKHTSQLSTITVPDAVEKLLATKRKNARSEVHTRDIESRLGRFAKAFPKPLRDVSPTMVESFLDGLQRVGESGKPITNRTKKNHLRHIVSLYRFAAKQKLIPRDLSDDIQAIEMPEAEIGTIEVFTPEELRKLLDAALEHKPELIPYLLLGAFAGLRAAELHRLDWKHVHFDSGYVEVTAGNAKIRGRRRLVPMTNNLMRCLKPFAQPDGPIIPYTKMDNQLALLSEWAAVPWKHNGLRHSFISYRCAMTKNVPQVSYEAGNSPSMIHTHYLNMRTEAEAQLWFETSIEALPATTSASTLAQNG